MGMLVDNAIVVMENVFRHRQLGKPALTAASEGASEVAAAIVASTLTTIAVFLPLIFVKGVAGQLFKELAFTVTFSLLASLLVALSLIPRLAARIKPRRVETEERLWMRVLRSAYLNTLKAFLKFKYFFLAGIILLTGICFIMLKGVDKELMPKVDQREFMIKVDMPTGTKIEVTDRVVKRIESILLGYPDIKGVSVIIGSSKEKEYGGTVQTLGPHQAQIVVNLKKLSKRAPAYRKSQEVIQELQKDLLNVDLEGAKLEYVLQETIFKAALQGGKPVNIEVKGKDLDVLRSLSGRLMEEMKSVPGLYDISSDLMPAQPEVKINIMKEKAALYNLSVNSISLSAQAAIKGYVASKYKEEGREYDIRVRLREEDRDDLAKIRNILIHSPLGIEVPLADVAYLSRGLGPSEIHRLDQERTVMVSANIYKRGFSEVISDIDNIIAGMDIPKGYVVKMSGERKEMEESFKSLIFALILAVVLVYMIMASQFESLWQPFIIMFTLPLSIIGVTAALLLTHTTLNVVVFLGVIVLGGIVVNNGIVLIDRVNGLRREGFSPYQAVLEAGQNRLRPILMTAMTTTLGLIPLALGLGEGAELRAPMAITVIGGLTSSTFLTLFVIPALYLIAVNIMERKPEVKVEEKEEREEEVKKELVVIPPPERGELQEKISEPEVEQVQDLNPRQKKAMEYIRKQGKITRKEYIQLFNVSVATAARDIKELQERGLIVPRGPNGPGRWYEVNKDNRESPREGK